MADGNVENAVMLFFEMGGSPGPVADDAFLSHEVDESHMEVSGRPEPPITGAEGPGRSERLRALADHLTSATVQMKAPAEVESVPLHLQPCEVAKVFKDHVPGVTKFMYREHSGEPSLQYIQKAYKDGLTAFEGTPLHRHLLALMRIIVHHGYENAPGASGHLKEVAEAFTDCQAVQARTIERVGLQISGVSSDFVGLVTGLVGEYKAMALKMLAAEHIAQRVVRDDANPAHYENRLTADIGQPLGLNELDVRRAALDQHATERFSRIQGAGRQAAIRRCRELFDADAFLKAFVAEVNGFSASSAEGSLPRLFLDWAAEHLTPAHVVMDEATCSRVDVGEELGLAILEVLFLGTLGGPSTEMYRHHSLWGLFCGGSGAEEELPVPQAAVADAAMPGFEETALHEMQVESMPWSGPAGRGSSEEDKRKLRAAAAERRLLAMGGGVQKATR